MKEVCIIHIDDQLLPREQVQKVVDDHLPIPVHFEQFSGTERDIGEIIHSILENTQKDITTVIISDYDIHKNYDGAVVLAWAKKLGVQINNMILYTSSLSPKNIHPDVKVIQKSYLGPTEVIQTKNGENRLRHFQTDLHKSLVSIVLNIQKEEAEKKALNLAAE